jgi:hypothetical protein
MEDPKGVDIEPKTLDQSICPLAARVLLTRSMRKASLPNQEAMLYIVRMGLGRMILRNRAALFVAP